jgi:PAS domain S-box-containing protein
MAETRSEQATDGHNHHVQFYDDVAPVLAELAQNFARVLAAGDSAVVFATPEHRADLALDLTRRGCDLDYLVAVGRYQAFDARDVLQQIMPDGQFDPARFADIAGGAIRRGRAAAASAQPSVVVFGELVALLCLDGAHDAALKLERFWSELLATEPCTLRCAYPLDAFPQCDDLAALEAICAAHTHVTPADTYADPSETARALELVRVQHLARASETASRQRAEAQALAHQREAELADFLEEVPIALHRVDADGVIRWANRAELELTGYARDEYIGRPIADMHADAATIADILARLARGEALHDYPARLRRKDGAIRQVVISSNARWTNGAFSHTRCVTRDVTDQLRADEAMTRLAAIVDSTDDAVIGKTLDGVITSWNRAAERLYHYTAEEAIGQPITLIVPPERRAELADILARLARGEQIAHHETERVRRDGSRVEVSLSISPIRDASGKIIGASKIARDITERRAAERRRQAFLEMLAHDLRSPLTAVRGYAQLMQRRQAFNPRATEAIIAEASRMGRLVNDVLEMARLDSARLELRRGEVDLVALACRCAEQSTLLAQAEREVRVEAADESVIGVWDGDRLAQVVTNLIDNALKYAPDGPIVVRLEGRPNEAGLAVIDQGPGIAPAEQDHIFERFGRAAETTASGMGLGLYISRALVTAHGGRLWVDSTPGQGSTFSLTLPYAPPDDAGEAPSAGASPAAEARGVASALGDARHRVPR